MPWHTVEQGEWVGSIAEAYRAGDWLIVFNHHENEELRRRRPNPHLLCPGDRLFVPEAEVKWAPAVTERRHRFVTRKKTVPIKIVVKDENDRPVATKPYRMVIDGRTYEGETDANGLLVHDIPVGAREGRLEVDVYQYPLFVSHLDPITEITGVQARLNNLGYDAGDVDGTLGEATTAAIRSFQSDQGLRPTGELSSDTREKLRRKYGC